MQQTGLFSFLGSSLTDWRQFDGWETMRKWLLHKSGPLIFPFFLENVSNEQTPPVSQHHVVQAKAPELHKGQLSPPPLAPVLSKAAMHLRFESTIGHKKIRNILKTMYSAEPSTPGP